MIVIRAGDILSIKEGNAMDSSKEEIKTYRVEQIPKHKRFITCRLIVKEKQTNVICSFTAHELKESLVQVEKGEM